MYSLLLIGTSLIISTALADIYCPQTINCSGTTYSTCSTSDPNFRLPAFTGSQPVTEGIHQLTGVEVNGNPAMCMYYDSKYQSKWLWLSSLANFLWADYDLKPNSWSNYVGLCGSYDSQKINTQLCPLTTNWPRKK